MKEDFLILFLIVFVSFGLTILTSIGPIYIKENKNFLKFNIRGYIVLFFGLSIIGLSVRQYNISLNAEKINKAQELKRDSTITAEVTKGIENNRYELFRDLSIEFAKQDLQLETLKETFLNFKDSVKTISIIAPYEDPILIVRENDITHKWSNDTIFFDLTLVFMQAPAKVCDLKIICELKFKNGTNFLLNSVGVIDEEINFPENQPYKTGFIVQVTGELESVIFGLFGNYCLGNDNGKTILRDAYYYSLTNKKAKTVNSSKKNSFFKRIEDDGRYEL